MVAICHALERAAVDPASHTPHAMALSALVARLCAVKENRGRLIEFGVGKWLVSLVFTHTISPRGATHAQAAIKTLEVDEDGVRAIQAIVKERITQAPTGTDAGSVYSLSRSDRAAVRLHWTQKVMLSQEDPAGKSSASQASSAKALMQRYLTEQAAQNGQDEPAS